MKKLLLSIMTVSIVGTSTASVVACAKPASFNQEIYLITDAGKINDKSFNEASYEGTNFFNQEILGNKQTKAAFIEPKDTAAKTFETAYKTAAKNKAKTLVLPGFHHALEEQGGHQAPQIMSGQGSTVLLDYGHGAKNEVGVIYRGDVSGFYAGMAAILSEVARQDNTVSLATFGGVSNPTAVDGFMVGYLSAINVYNLLSQEQKISLFSAFDIPEEKINEKLAIEVKGTQTLSEKTAVTDTNWFSQSFILGDASAKVLPQLVAKKPTIIMPVAGAQTQDAIGFSNTYKIVGVDTNQALAYPSNKGRFITSAEKDLKHSTVISMAHTPEWKDVKLEDGSTVLTKTASLLKDKITLTKEVDGKFVNLPLDQNEIWTGQTIWVNGNLSSGQDNDLTLKQADAIRAMFTPEKLTQTSIMLFNDYINQGDWANYSIVNSTIVEAYAKSILEL